VVTIGRYKIVRRLAIGGMAEVFLAKVAGPGGFEKLVVLKRILPQLADSEMYVKMFLEEARVAAQLDHPNIVHVFDFGEIDGTYFLTMEYVEGATLKQLARWGAQTEETRLPPHVIAHVASQVCAGLGYAHAFTAPETGEMRPLVHRDVSPENIMVSRSGSVKLLDFGVAKVATDDDRSVVGMLKGKISYMPPEQLEGADSVDHRIDLYALGVVMYHTLSGRRPYEADTELGLIDAILKGQPVPLLKHRLDLSDDLLAIVDRAISRKPEDRFQSCAEMRRALDAYIAQGGKTIDAGELQSLVQRFLLEGGNRGHAPDRSASASPASVQM
jgi:serine/threonine protein kinase